MLIDNRVFEPYTMEFNSPLTDEDWEKLEDADFDHTKHVWFHTKNGKEVHFYKNAIPIEWIKSYAEKNRNYSPATVREITAMLDEWRRDNGDHS